MHNRRQFLTLRRALLRALEEPLQTGDIDRLFLECGLPSELFGIKPSREDDLHARLQTLCDDLEMYSMLADE